MASSGPVFAYLKLYGHNLSAGERQRRKQLQTLVRKYFCPKVGQEYKSPPLSLSLLGSVRLHLQLLHIQLRLKHSPKLPQPLPKEPKWEIPFLGMFCHLVPSWEISSVCALGRQKHQELLSLGEHKCFRRTKRCRSLDLGALAGQTHG